MIRTSKGKRQCSKRSENTERVRFSRVLISFKTRPMNFMNINRPTTQKLMKKKPYRDKYSDR